MERKSHWEDIYSRTAPTQVGWYQEHPTASLRFIEQTNIGKAGQIVDIGGGASTLVDHLLADGYAHVTVLDVSAKALQAAKKRLGVHADEITWVEADVTEVRLPLHIYDIWHDRAVFHFLTLSDERWRYIQSLQNALRPGGHAIMATFSLDGPPTCSGLEVVRYSPESLLRELGDCFGLVDSSRETHTTPSGREQKYVFCHFRRVE
jgi:ubiquinone/menaquinone biosynthesis C-methylase UbiE